MKKRKTIEHLGLAADVGSRWRIDDNVATVILDHCDRPGEGKSARTQYIDTSFHQWHHDRGKLGWNAAGLRLLVEAGNEVLGFRMGKHKHTGA